LKLSPGLYEQLINELLQQELTGLDPAEWVTDAENLDVADSPSTLSRYLQRVVLLALESFEGEGLLRRRVTLCNNIVELLDQAVPDSDLEGYKIPVEVELLLTLLKQSHAASVRGETASVSRPSTPLSQSTLLTGSRLEPSLASELRKEILSADSVDILMSFIKWSGLRLVEEALREFTSRPDARLRLITTSYMGATDLRAVALLAELPHTEIRVSYDTHRTRLHAKAYLFHRDSGFTTAYIGSSNISSAAMTSGLEWNLKVSAQDAPDIVAKFRGTFESYWSDPEFQVYTTEDEPRLREALNAERADPQHQYLFDMHPYGFQQDILDRLKAERDLHGRRHNLVVAATGTGKTVVAAFDYKRYCDEHPGCRNRLLFVAHREEILQQALSCFRNVLHDANFGDVLVGTSVPHQTDYLFVSIQMIQARGVGRLISGSRDYDYVVVDEFHRAAADTYRSFLEYVEPDVLLGLTATPERMDGKDILAWFGGRIAAEIRLPEAIERSLLCPFQYFGVTDVVDLDQLRWTRGGYDVHELESAYSSNEQRAQHVVTAVRKYCKNIMEVRGLGFCVSIEHSKFMADFFSRSNIPAMALSSETPADERAAAQGKLRNREINFIFAVDLYNEGVDIPEIDTVLFLRPTESLTIFLQQLGRGLRTLDGKECLTVLDFIGKAHRNFSFESHFQALLGHTNRSTQKEVEDDFPFLPKGCSIQLERVAKQSVLNNIRAALRSGRSSLVQRIGAFEEDARIPLSLARFLEYYHLDSRDIYETGSSWSRLCAEADTGPAWQEPDEERLTKGLSRVAHVDSPAYLQFIIDVLTGTGVSGQSDNRFAVMLYCDLWRSPVDRGTCSSWSQVLEVFSRNPVLRREYCELAQWNLDHISLAGQSIELPFDCSLELHRSYTRDEVLAGLGYFTFQRQPLLRAGVLNLPRTRCDLLLVTLHKSDKDYSPTTMYRDYAISDRLFHWQSQSTTSDTSVTGQRYMRHAEEGSTVLLFVREEKRERGQGAPYAYLGPINFVQSEGSRPMNILWELVSPMPARLWQTTETLLVSD
jgi:superfamily II DNA or RNA helicase